MANEIKGAWDQETFDLDDFRASIGAINEYRPRPDVTLTLSKVKGLSQEHLEAIVRMLDMDEVKYTVSLTATPTQQFRLFGPGDPGLAVAAAEKQLGLDGGE